MMWADLSGLEGQELKPQAKGLGRGLRIGKEETVVIINPPPSL
jgi:hypothetical protein